MKPLFCVFGIALASGSPAADIPLRVTESAGIARRAEPISGGVPLPRGSHPTGQEFALFRGGREIPCQTPALVVETGTLRWVLVDFQDDVEAGATNEYVLRPASHPRRAGALSLKDAATEVIIDAGRLRLSVSKTEPFGLFRSVAIDGREIVSGGEVTYTALEGRTGWNDRSPWKERTLAAGPPDATRIPYAGPLRATIEVIGRFAGDPRGAGYKAWITAWAGKTYVDVKVKLCNSNPDRYTAIPVARSGIALRLRDPIGSVLRAADDPKDIARGGWIAARGAKTISVCDRLFATDTPRRLDAKDGAIVLEGIAGRRWLYDCTHHTSEYRIDFDAPSDAAALDTAARAYRNRLWVLAPAGYYAACDAFGMGSFGSLDDEKACYERWGWSFSPDKIPARSAPLPAAFQRDEDNHYESEADSVQALLLEYVRTGQRGWFDLGEAWARYHMDLQAWRTDGWAWKDGAIWFPMGGPQGNLRVREDWNFAWGPNWGERERDPDCAALWRLANAKSCYCHFYGSGLADYYCLTGDPDALAAAIDDVEQKDDEFRRYRKFQPGKTPIGCIRGFGRGFEVLMRVLQADPGNAMIRDLAHLCARTLWSSPDLDERGFHPSLVGGGFGGMPAKAISPAMKAWMDERGIRVTLQGDTIDSLSKGERTWKVRCFGGTWMHAYVQNGADLYARYFDDDDMRDFAIAFGRFTARYLLSPKCHQTWYTTYFDVPDLGMVWDPWVFDHADTKDGEGCVHSGWYTRFFPDACARAYAWTGEPDLLEKAREFWYYGSKREYQTKHLAGGPNEVHRFARHVPPKDDDVLSTARLFFEASHPRRDADPPAPIADLEVEVRGEEAVVRFTAPADPGSEGAARYQVKCAGLPIIPDEDFEYARDAGVRRAWWRAANLGGEPAPAAPGTRERFVVAGVPAGARFFAVRAFDASGNRSPLGRVVEAR
ncbi:MAG: hypothetical protein JXP34_25215 [Planctomycetes bacterium]|nr:hypothetical protein [Planctomycetota bacterium]